MYIIDSMFLTQNSVSIIFPDGNRKAFANSPNGRIQLENEVPQETFDEVLEIWGETPTLPDPQIPETQEPIESPILSNAELTEAVIYLNMQNEQLMEAMKLV